MIKMGKLVVWLLLLLGICTRLSGRPSVVNIGAIFPFNSTIGKVARVAILAAQNDVNSNPHVLGGTKLNIFIRDSEYSGFLGIIQALQLIESEVMAIIGPQSSVMAHVISNICDELQVPLLSFASTDPTLLSLRHSFFVRTTQSDLFQMAAIANMIDHFGWREVVVLYIDDDYGRNGIAALAEKLAEKRCTISYKAAMNPDVRKEYITDVLAKVALSESRIMILHTYNSYGLQVLDVAHFLGMMERGYVWFATNWLTDILDTNSSLSASNTEHIQGVITLRMHTANTRLKQEFISRWRNLTRMESVKGTFGLNTFGLYAYDSVWLLAHALGRYLDQGGNLSFSDDPKLRPLQGCKLNLGALKVFDGGNELLESIMKTNMSGLTGLVKFNQDGNLVHPAFEIINVIGTGYRRIGYWSNQTGLSVHAPEDPSKSDQKLYPVIWPGQTTEKPRGWVFTSNGRQMRIGVPNRVSYLDFVAYSPSTRIFSGYCIDVFLAAVDLLPYALPFELIPFGDGHNNPSCTELIESMNAGNYDASIGDIAITTNRTKMADFTQPYIESGLVVLAPLRASESNAWAFLRPFTLRMWCATVIAFLVVGAVVWILEHRINDYFRGTPRNQVATMLSFSFSTLFFTHKGTLGTLGKMVLIIWLFAVLIIRSTYTAGLTSVLTVQQLSSPVKGIESLMQDNDPIGYQKGSFVRNYLTEQLNVHESRLIALNSADEYARALNRGPKNGGVAAVIDERAYIELFLSTRCEFTIVGQTLTKTGWGFAFPRDSPLAVDMSTALLKLSESGDLQRIHDKWLTKNSCGSRGSKLSIGYLELKSFWGLFALSGLACFLALLAYIFLMVKQFVKHCNEEGERPQRRSPCKRRRLSRFLSFVDEKKRNSKDSPCERTSSGRQLETVPEILQSPSGV